ncbi:MAG: zinc metallopeptidase [Lachnospirales bacterium]
MFYFDWTFLILIPAMLVSMYAQAKLTSTYSTYSQVRNRHGYTGADVAQMLLSKNGINDVRVEYIKGNLTDHYDPTAKVIRLSDAVYSQTSVAALGVAAHETGHAIQDNVGYAPLRFRHALFPITNLSSKMALPIFMLGLFFGTTSGILMQIGIYLFAFTVLFQLVTLPVEFNASSRALDILEDAKILEPDEIKPAQKVLAAAALTYVAAAFTAILNLVRLLVIARNRND